MIREHCFLRTLSRTAQPNSLFLSLARKLNSVSVSSLLSCASSSRRMTSYAMCNFIFVSEMMLLLHFFSALAVQWSLCPSRWNGSVCCVGAFHADATTSWKRGRRIQTFSNLKGVGLRGPALLHRSSGQWSEWEEESACRMWSSKAMSQA